MKYSVIQILNKKIEDRLGNKVGSAMVMLAIVFTGFALCIAGAIGISRQLVVSSECECFGRVWTKAVLSEYDVHLLEDYSIMAYFGNDSDISKKIGNYLNYSSKNKLDEKIIGANADLTGYELGDPANFRQALRLGFASSATAELINGRGRTYRGLDDMDGYEEEGRIINNRVVLDTLPSSGSAGSVSSESVVERLRTAGDTKDLGSMITGGGCELLLIVKCFDSHVTKASDKNHFFVNEWEYLIRGSNDDEVNYRACRRILFLVRNALNLAAIYKDPAKVEAIVAVAEAITPGPMAAVTQLIIAEAWAAIETEEDLDDLYHDRRVPVMKTPEQWKTDLSAVLDSKEMNKKLDDGSKALLGEKKKELQGIGKGIKTVKQFSEGLSYDEYLMVMILAMNENTRLLRIMDLVQINMKYGYYRDFNLMEYYTGVRFTIDEGMRSHVFEDTYK